jgi:hypothetical protein
LLEAMIDSFRCGWMDTGCLQAGTIAATAWT